MSIVSTLDGGLDLFVDSLLLVFYVYLCPLPLSRDFYLDFQQPWPEVAKLFAGLQGDDNLIGNHIHLAGGVGDVGRGHYYDCTGC